MLKYIFLLLLSFNILNAEEGVVKTSELELFLFKIGFESLLKDVDITKDKSTLNEKEIKEINEKIELIMSELYKDKRVLLNSSDKVYSSSNIDKEELSNLKNEIEFLKKEIKKLKEIPKVKVLKENKKYIIRNVKSNLNQMRVATSFLAVYSKQNTQTDVIRKIKRNSIIKIDNCNNGWCKLKDEDYFVRRYLLKEFTK